MLVIDHDLMITDRDEANYHEMIAYVPLVYLHKQQSPKYAEQRSFRVLVIGGGDGGTVTRVLKFNDVHEVVWCEIDEKVSDAQR